MAINITVEERDALYDQILDRLSGIGDVWLALARENYSEAERLGREYSDELRLVLDDLGFGDDRGEMIELTTPPDVLRRVFRVLGQLAAGKAASVEAELTAISRDAQSTRLVADTCSRVLAVIDPDSSQ